MRISLTDRLSFSGNWCDEHTSDSLKTYIYYRLLNYLSGIKASSITLSVDDIIDFVYRIENIRTENGTEDIIEDKDRIKKTLLNLELEDSKLLIEEMLKDSSLSKAEIRKLEYITYYLNWRADNLTRRMSYDCYKCKHEYAGFRESRLCFIEDKEIELPNFLVEYDDEGKKYLEEKGIEFFSSDDFVERLGKLNVLNPNLSIFEIGQRYYEKVKDIKNGIVDFKEVCPEGVRLSSDNLSELFEMEARCNEYHIFPFNGGQLDQPLIIIEAFDAIRTGRNIWGAKLKSDMIEKAKRRKK